MGLVSSGGRARINRRAAAKCRYGDAAQERSFSAPCGSGRRGKSANRPPPWPGRRQLSPTVVRPAPAHHSPARATWPQATTTLRLHMSRAAGIPIHNLSKKNPGHMSLHSIIGRRTVLFWFTFFDEVPLAKRQQNVTFFDLISMHSTNKYAYLTSYSVLGDLR